MQNQTLTLMKPLHKVTALGDGENISYGFCCGCILGFMITDLHDSNKSLVVKQNISLLSTPLPLVYFVRLTETS